MPKKSKKEMQCETTQDNPEKKIPKIYLDASTKQIRNKTPNQKQLKSPKKKL